MSADPWKLRRIADDIGGAGWPGYANVLAGIADEVQAANTDLTVARARIEALEALTPTPEPVASPWQPMEIIDAIKAKQAKNEARTWPDWRTMSEDQAIEHVRPAPLPAPPTEPSPDTKAERYTVIEGNGRFDIYDGDQWYVAVTGPLVAKRVAAALNSTSDPLLVGLVDACRGWQAGVLTDQHLSRTITAYRHYLAEQEGE